MLYSSCSPSFDFSNKIWQVLQIMKLSTVQLFQSTCTFLPCTSKYSSQRAVLKHMWPCTISSVWETKFHTHTKPEAKLLFLCRLYFYITNGRTINYGPNISTILRIWSVLNFFCKYNFWFVCCLQYLNFTTFSNNLLVTLLWFCPPFR